MILNVGCGQHWNKDHIGIDIEGKPDILMDAANLGFRDNIFHKAVSDQVFEHLKNPYHALIEIRRVLIRKGLFEISVPNVLTLRAFIRWALKGRISASPEHIQAWRIPEINNFLKLGGFTLVNFELETHERFHKLPLFDWLIAARFPRIGEKNLKVWGLRD